MQNPYAPTTNTPVEDFFRQQSFPGRAAIATGIGMLLSAAGLLVAGLTFIGAIRQGVAGVAFTALLIGSIYPCSIAARHYRAGRRGKAVLTIVCAAAVLALALACTIWMEA